MDKVQELNNMIRECNKIVFFSGAGVSTESGIKDFRSKEGLYNEKYKMSPEYMLSSDCFYSHNKEFYEFYKDKLNCLNIEPNITHNYLKKLENENKLLGIITQNIDGLHTKAGNKKVYEIHGSIYRNHCIKCKKFYDASYVFNSKDIPLCECGGLIKPDVVLYGESLPDYEFTKSIEIIKEADLMIIAGTSLNVYPAAGMIDYFKGKYLVIINLDDTSYDYKCDLVIHDKLSNVFSRLG